MPLLELINRSAVLEKWKGKGKNVSICIGKNVRYIMHFKISENSSGKIFGFVVFILLILNNYEHCNIFYKVCSEEFPKSGY